MTPFSGPPTKNIMAMTILFDVLSRNKDTEIGKKWKFASISTVQDYRSNVPLTDYEDYRPYVDRMVEKGENNLIVNGKVTYYAPTSGTTSKSKLIPRFVTESTRRFPLQYNQLMLLTCWYTHTYTPAGVPIIPGSTADVGAAVGANPASFAAPLEAYKIHDVKTALYVQLVLGLKNPSVDCIVATFCTTVVTAFNLLAQEWRQMIEDIKTGSLTQLPDLPEEQRTVLQGVMGKPDPQRAEKLLDMFLDAKSVDFEGIAHRLWPKLTVVYALAGGTLSTYIPQVQHYMGSEIHLFSDMYLSSEGVLGINKWPGQHISAYSLNTDSVFFEFIPLSEAGSKSPTKVLLAEEVEKGDSYEIVITTQEGLYRYRLGDLVKVLEPSCGTKPPMIEVLGRVKMTLHLHAKLNDFHIGAAICALAKGPWRKCLIEEYMVTAETKCIPPKYKFWIEPSSSDMLDASLLAISAALVDKELTDANVDYAAARSANMLALPAVAIVNSGTFGLVMEVLKRRSPVAETQMKMPHVTTDSAIIQVLEDNVCT